MKELFQIMAELILAAGVIFYVVLVLTTGFEKRTILFGVLLTSFSLLYLVVQF
ncbi:hypothetical protein HG66A1_16650 [Gimesia chilikensis]|uniref:Uncharacterized protein n=1 Tax=Gimesia chilikensis TaxID=2605989 RepID=A0A517PKJ5_9PLAN|nr:hypothetical protein HG66A1_16650 [Gimesia chilikensis]